MSFDIKTVIIIIIIIIIINCEESSKISKGTSAREKMRSKRAGGKFHLLGAAAALAVMLAISSTLSSRLSSSLTSLLSYDKALDAAARLDLDAQNRRLEMENHQMASRLAQMEDHQAAFRLAQLRMKRSFLSGGERDAMRESKENAQRMAVVPVHSTVDAKVEAFKKLVESAKKENRQKLTGYFVRSCSDDGKNCVNRYSPEWDEDFKMTPRNVTAHHLGIPLGPTVRQVPWDSYNRPENDIMPKANFLGANFVGYGANDRYVPYDFTNINPAVTLVPPWKRDSKVDEMKGRERAWELSLPKTMVTDYHRACPMNETTGVGCLFGDDGVDGVTEATFFSEGYGADERLGGLAAKGVNVDSWALMNASRHKWDAKGEDHPPGDVPPFEWEGLKEPEWAYENSAMRSQGWKSEGDKNIRLMKGSMPDYDDKLGVADRAVDAAELTKQLQVQHQVEIENDDHFADWEPNSDKNKLLVFGTSHTLAGQRWDPEAHKFVHDGWTLWNNSVPAAEAAAAYRGAGARPLPMVRTGDFLRDAVLNQGWQVTNMVGAADNNLERGVVGASDEVSPDKLEKLGVNV